MDEFERELRARLMAAEHVIIAAMGWLAPEATEFNKRMFMASMKTVLTSSGLPMNLSDEEAEEHTETILMMRTFLKDRIEAIEASIEMPPTLDPPRAWGGDSQ